MEPRLLEAATTGNVNSLRSLMREDMLLLESVALVGAQTPLHIASMRGHLSFVQEMLKVKKEFAYELNQDGFSPLHLASANGHLQIVHELLKVDIILCSIKGREQRLPLHCAVVKGRIDVMKELVSASPISVESKTTRGETPLHLAVKNNQFGAFKLLVERVKQLKKESVLNAKDNQGNTVLHLAVSRKQYEVVELLLVGEHVRREMMEVNLLNERGMTPLDVLVLMESEAGDLEIHTKLVKAGAKSGKGIDNEANMQPHATVEITDDNQLATNNSSEEPVAPKGIEYWPRLEDVAGFFGYNGKRDSINDVRNALLTVAALLASATYQAVLSPPGGVWQDDDNGHTAGKSIMATKSETVFWLFILGNSLGFYTSLHTICYLTSGFPLQYPLLLLMGSISVNYSSTMYSLVPDLSRSSLIYAPTLAVLFGVLVPFVPSIVRKLHKWYKNTF